MNLYELTQHEAGIIIHTTGEIIVANWCNYDDDEMPVLSPIGTLLPWKESDGYLDGAETTHVDDYRSVLPGTVWLTDETDANGDKIADTDLNVLYDAFNDIARSFLSPEEYVDFDATVFTLQDGTIIISPSMWN